MLITGIQTQRRIERIPDLGQGTLRVGAANLLYGTLNCASVAQTVCVDSQGQQKANTQDR